MGLARDALRSWLAHVWLLAAASGVQAAPDESVETLPLQGTTQRVLISRDATAPVMRVVVVFPGGDGELGLADSPPPPPTPAQGFVSSLRLELVRPGIAIVLVDSPSHLRKMPLAYRESAEYRALLQQLLAQLRLRFAGVPLYLLGYSNGAVSALAAAREPGVAGVIIVSGIFLRYADVAGFGADAPLLVVHHEADRCIPPDFDESFRVRLRPTMVRSIALPYGVSACGPASAHQFHGQESAVAGAIQLWLTTGRASSRIR
jgi:dienelactone hydrolase